MDKYSKSKLVAKRYVFAGIVVMVAVVILLALYLVRMLTTKNIVYENIDRQASNVSSEEAENATPIILNNIVIGGVYNKKWVDSLNYYQHSKFKDGIEVDVFNRKGKNGTFKIEKVYSSGTKYDTVYAEIIKNDYISEYYAISKDSAGLNLSSSIEITQQNEKEYIKQAKKAISKYNYMNNTMKIQEAYSVSLNFDNKYTLLFVTNDGKVKRGVYSAVIAIPTIGEPVCIKYNYYRNVNNAADFGVYSFKFIGDLNGDGTSEIILQSTQEFTSTYYVIELKNNNFYEILRSTINIEN